MLLNVGGAHGVEKSGYLVLGLRTQDDWVELFVDTLRLLFLALAKPEVSIQFNTAMYKPCSLIPISCVLFVFFHPKCKSVQVLTITRGVPACAEHWFTM